MEEVLIVIVQFLAEFVFQIVAELPWDWIGGRDWLESRWGIYLFGLFVGGGAAWLSLAIHHHSFLKDPALRIANVAVAPLVAANFSRWMALRRRRNDPDVDPEFHFWLSLWFSLGFAAVRFGFAVR